MSVMDINYAMETTVKQPIERFARLIDCGTVFSLLGDQNMSVTHYLGERLSALKLTFLFFK